MAMGIDMVNAVQQANDALGGEQPVGQPASVSVPSESQNDAALRQLEGMMAGIK